MVNTESDQVYVSDATAQHLGIDLQVFSKVDNDYPGYRCLGYMDESAIAFHLDAPGTPAALLVGAQYVIDEEGARVVIRSFGEEAAAAAKNSRSLQDPMKVIQMESLDDESTKDKDVGSTAQGIQC
jgi:hypothetical protein